MSDAAAPSGTPAPPARAAVRVRAVTRGDIPRVWELVRGLAEYERLLEFLTGSPERLATLLFETPGGLEGLVAEADQATVGYALYYTVYSSFRTTRRLWLEDLFVDPAARATGAGRALLAAVAGAALDRGCDRVDWYVLDWNRLAIDFYERQGARATIADWLPYGMGEPEMRRLVGGVQSP